MKLSLLSTAALAASAFAAPASSASGAVATANSSAVPTLSAPANSSAVSTDGPLTFNKLAVGDEAWGTIDCDPITKLCRVQCRLAGVNIACQLVGIFDSFFYGIEQLAGFTVKCNAEGCQALCPAHGTVVCAADEVVATFDSVWVVAESLVLGGITWVLDSVNGNLFGGHL